MRFGATRFGSGALMLLLGLGLAVQVESPDQALPGAREQDLAVILRDLSERRAALQQEMASLGRQTRDLDAGGGGAALRAAEHRRRVLEQLAGTAPARGPGVRLDIGAPVTLPLGDVVLEALQELRDAGAEALELEGVAEGGRRAVRIVDRTWVYDAPDGGLLVGGQRLRPPYELRVIGPAQDLADRMVIPGGISQVLEQVGATVAVERADVVDVATVLPLQQMLPSTQTSRRPAG